MSDTKRLTRDSLLLALALIIFVIELQIPPLIPIPGVKLGLANIITVYSLFVLSPLDTFLILVLRILIGSIFSGQFMSFLFSMGGGLCCFIGMCVIKKILTTDQIWVASIFGSLFHNIGQIIVSIIMYQSVMMLTYLPILIVSGIITGLFTGLIAQIIVHRLK